LRALGRPSTRTSITSACIVPISFDHGHVQHASVTAENDTYGSSREDGLGETLTMTASLGQKKNAPSEEQIHGKDPGCGRLGSQHPPHSGPSRHAGCRSGRALRCSNQGTRASSQSQPGALSHGFHVPAHCRGMGQLEVTNCDLKFRPRRAAHHRLRLHRAGRGGIRQRNCRNPIPYKGSPAEVPAIFDSEA